MPSYTNETILAGEGNAGGHTAIAGNHTPSGSDIIVTVDISTYAFTNGTINSITFDGNAMTLIGIAINPDIGSDRYVKVFSYQIAVTKTTVQALSVSFDDDIEAYICSIKHWNDAGGIDALSVVSTKGNNNACEISMSVNDAGSIICVAGSARGADTTPFVGVTDPAIDTTLISTNASGSSGSSSFRDVGQGNGYAAVELSGGVPIAQTVGFDISASDYWAVIAYEIQPAGTPPATDDFEGAELHLHGYGISAY
ncbi:MAG: hypothetical protein GY943_00945 [Chloroflexi bacterium]|nr:hypothetical protein [Chloroflexota bacterium]